MRRKGFGRDAIQAALIAENRLRCDPPLSDSEVKGIAASIARYLPHSASAKDPIENWPFDVMDDGVYWLGPGGISADGTRLRLAARVDVIEKTRDLAGKHHGRLLRWLDTEGFTHEWAMPMEALASDTSNVRARLFAEGLSYIATHARLRERFVEYLQTAPVPGRPVLCASRIGWHKQIYVLPGLAVGPDGNEEVIYQNDSEAPNQWNRTGTSDEWRVNIGVLCVGNSRLILTACCAFAGPLLSLLEAESGGIHIVGPTSTGKTTALVVGASVCGGPGFVQSWRSTSNALELVAEAHNDATLFLDELAQLDPREAAETSYLLSNGQGKSRMTRDIGGRRKPNWRLLFVSTGEITLAEHAQSAGKRTSDGAEVRLLSIGADAGSSRGLFENLHGTSSPDSFARQLRQGAGKYHGAVFRDFVTQLVRDRPNAQRAAKLLRDKFVTGQVTTDAAGQVRRAADRFGVIAAAGELATEYGLTGWPRGEATHACERCFHEWINARGPDPTHSAIRQIRALLEAHGSSRFQDLSAPPYHGDGQIHDRLGFRRETDAGDVEFLILREAFRNELCRGFDSIAVARELSRRGLLLRSGADMTIKPRLPELGLVRVYCIKGAILDEV